MDIPHPTPASDHRRPAPKSEPRTLTADVLLRLREDLLAGRFKPNQKLRLEELRKVYGVGFTPLREALMRLAADGLVVVVEQRGFRAAPVSLDDLWDVTRLRQEIEAIALRDALALGDDAWEAEIVAAFHRLSKTRNTDPETKAIDPEWARRHHAFHYALIAGAKSQWIKRFWQILYDQSDRYRRIGAISVPEGRQREHRELMRAALRRDTEQMIRLSQAHIRKTATIVAQRLRHYESTAIEDVPPAGRTGTKGRVARSRVRPQHVG
jgi:DNA-binding GntR family transcriptional regulator